MNPDENNSQAEIPGADASSKSAAKRGRPRKQPEAGAEGDAPKKRGRPRKSAAADGQPAAGEPEASVSETTAAPAPDPTVPASVPLTDELDSLPRPRRDAGGRSVYSFDPDDLDEADAARDARGPERAASAQEPLPVAEPLTAAPTPVARPAAEPQPAAPVAPAAPADAHMGERKLPPFASPKDKFLFLKQKKMWRGSHSQSAAPQPAQPAQPAAEGSQPAAAAAHPAATEESAPAASPEAATAAPQPPRPQPHQFQQQRPPQQQQGARPYGHQGPQQGGGPRQPGPQQQQPQPQQRRDKFEKFDKFKDKKAKGRLPKDISEIFTYNPGGLAQWEPLQGVGSMARLADEHPVDPDAAPVLLNDFLVRNFKELLAEAQDMGIRFETAPTKYSLFESLIAHFAGKRAPVMVEGILDIDDDGNGILVYQVDSYRVRPHSAFLPQCLIRHFGLRKGQSIRARIIPHREGETCPIVVKLDQVMWRAPEEVRSIEQFEELTPYYPTERILLENDPSVKWDNIAMRAIDLLTPIGLGQRTLIVAPPRTGKTVLLQCIANTIVSNCPRAHLIVLLVDERPEEVTDFIRQVSKGEVISSTFDEAAESHVHAAEMVIEKARRMVEVGKDVIILLDSITRLARAYNTLSPNSGKILSGGVEATALQRPKRFFGSARNIEDGGSLTIIGTALVETGSKMDEVVFEEFKGTGNMELHLDRALSDKRIFPAINLERSGTRKEELLYHPMEMEKVISLRRAMKGIPATDAMEMLLGRIRKSRTNAEFLMGLNR